MKRLLLSLGIVSLVGIPALQAAGGPQSSKQRTPSTTPATQAAKPTPVRAQRSAARTHVVTVNAEFVSYDAKAKTITFKDDKGQTSTAPLQGKALSEAGHFKGGDRMMLRCRDNAAGVHLAVTAIQSTKGKG